MRPSLGSAEVGPLVAAALELVEPRRACDQDDAVPELAGVLALGRGRHDGTEERDALDGDDRGADLLRSEEHTSELQSRQYLVCRLLLEKKKTTQLYTSSKT